ncbi:DMT family transporter [Sabulicella rubraurantiaca]|uniref:DMT family transporter n=1 Tax=Sabulicella rubraurantiaca TaxID=2811429 RepID=UPI001A95F4E9|nr:DMT family transporter [Sabulicella rubraurantiaca]
MSLLLAALYILIWGSAFNAARVVALEWSPLWALALRFALSVPALAVIRSLRRASFPRSGDAWRLFGMGTLGMGGYLACAWVASKHVPSGLVALLAATSPLFVALGSALRGEGMARLGWVGLALGWLGVAVLGLSRSADGLAAAEAWGIGLTLLGALLQAAGVLIYAPARARMDPWVANLGQTAVAALVLILLAVPFGGPLPMTASTPFILGMVYSCVVVGIGGYALFFIVIRRFGPSNAAALQLLSPPVAALIGWSLLGERLIWGDLVGGALTLGGLLLMFRARARG